ncbi:MAG: hypothetical protein Q4C47_00970 [Planctomycetia bacterium]|nr:hypothetical protein [Planctomycetia bacterium]
MKPVTGPTTKPGTGTGSGTESVNRTIAEEETGKEKKAENPESDDRRRLKNDPTEYGIGAYGEELSLPPSMSRNAKIGVAIAAGLVLSIGGGVFALSGKSTPDDRQLAMNRSGTTPVDSPDSFLSSDAPPPLAAVSVEHERPGDVNSDKDAYHPELIVSPEPPSPSESVNTEPPTAPRGLLLPDAPPVGDDTWGEFGSEPLSPPDAGSTVVDDDTGVPSLPVLPDPPATESGITGIGWEGSSPRSGEEPEKDRTTSGMSNLDNPGNSGNREDESLRWGPELSVGGGTMGTTMESLPETSDFTTVPPDPFGNASIPGHAPLSLPTSEPTAGASSTMTRSLTLPPSGTIASGTPEIADPDPSIHETPELPDTVGLAPPVAHVSTTGTEMTPISPPSLVAPAIPSTPPAMTTPPTVTEPSAVTAPSVATVAPVPAPSVNHGGNGSGWSTPGATSSIPESIGSDRTSTGSAVTDTPKSNGADGRTTALATNAGAGASVATGNTYQLPRKQTIFDVARAKLGSASRWPEIYRLNRTVIGDPLREIPAGTSLTLPSR